MQDNPPREELLHHVLNQTRAEAPEIRTLRPPLPQPNEELAGRLRRWLEAVDR